MAPITMPLSVSVVVPVYNSEPMLASLVGRLEAVLRQAAAPFELLLVNDGSSDGSWARIVELAAGRSWLRGICLMRNYGQHNALLCGIKAARYEIIVTLDDDLQNPPEEIPKLLAKLSEGHDVVYGTPDREEHGLWRNLAARITKLVLQSFMGAEIARSVSAFRAFRKQIRDAFVHYEGPFVSIDVLLTWGTARFAALRIRSDRRLVGASNYTFRTLVRHAMNMLTGFSVTPLQIASLVGFGFTMFGTLIFAVVVGRFLLQGREVPGFAFLASIVAIFSGAQLFGLGVLGEYLARMHFRTMGRPTYVVREATDIAMVTASPLPRPWPEA
jgi:undecaprenyl-phosphate 4-deoxy-4-formamido-L-arabinose transferase